MDRDDARELAHLRARAYGPDAEGLSPNELVRLKALEGRHSEPLAQEQSPASGSVDDPAPESAAEDVSAAEATDNGARQGVGARLAVVVLAILIPVAALGGYFLAPRTSPPAAVASSAVPLLPSGEYESTWNDTRAQVEALRDWDADIALLGASGDVAVWWGVSGTQTCVVVYAGFSGQSQACDATETVREQGLQMTVSRHILSSDDEGASAEEMQGREETMEFIGNPYTGRFMIAHSGR